MKCVGGWRPACALSAADWSSLRRDPDGAAGAEGTADDGDSNEPWTSSRISSVQARQVPGDVIGRRCRREIEHGPLDRGACRDLPQGGGARRRRRDSWMIGRLQAARRRREACVVDRFFGPSTTQCLGTRTPTSTAVSRRRRERHRRPCRRGEARPLLGRESVPASISWFIGWYMTSAAKCQAAIVGSARGRRRSRSASRCS